MRVVLAVWMHRERSDAGFFHGCWHTDRNIYISKVCFVRRLFTSHVMDDIKGIHRLGGKGVLG